MYGFAGRVLVAEAGEDPRGLRVAEDLGGQWDPQVRVEDHRAGLAGGVPRRGHRHRRVVPLDRVDPNQDSVIIRP
jgi:hypothetical protein